MSHDIVIVRPLAPWILVCVTLGLFTSASIVPNPAWADCPNKPISCGSLTVGWQGTCFKAFRGCEPCGPKYCPKELGQKDIKLKAVPKHPKGMACREFVLDDLLKKDGKGSACSAPAAVKELFPLADRVFGRSACLEHDICYRLPGLSRRDCDDKFNANMHANCEQHFYRHTKRRPAIAAANRPGFEACKVAATAFYRAVLYGAESMYNPSKHGPCQSIPR